MPPENTAAPAPQGAINATAVANMTNPKGDTPPAVTSEDKSAWIKKAAAEIREIPDDVSEEDFHAAEKKSATREDAVEEESETSTEDSPEKLVVNSKEDTTEDNEEGDGEAEGDTRQERQEVRKAWQQVQRAQARLRAKEQQMKHLAQDHARLVDLEETLRTDPYKVVEYFGGSLSDWQRRTLSGRTADPVVEDLKREMQMRDQKWEQKLRAIEQQKVSEEHQTYENNFVRQVEQEVVNHPHLKQYGVADATDMAHEFAEYVARGVSGRSDIPKSEIRHVEEYVNSTPRSQILNPQRIAAFLDKRIARLAAIAAGKASDEGSSKPLQKLQSTQKKPVLDNAAAGQRATPAHKMSKEDWIKMAAKEIHEVGDEE